MQFNEVPVMLTFRYQGKTYRKFDKKMAVPLDNVTQQHMFLGHEQCEVGSVEKEGDMKILIATLFLLIIPALTWASSPRIVETEYGVVVEYTGIPEDLKTVSETLSTQDMETQNTVTPATKPPIDLREHKNLNIKNLEAMRLPDSYGQVVYSFKATIENPGGAGSFGVRISGKNRDGFDVDHAYILGFIDHNDTRTLTGNWSFNPNIAKEIFTWEITLITKK